eukprot:scaffold93602_cov24-Phaeocystis_antarctica.AAC.1
MVRRCYTPLPRTPVPRTPLTSHTHPYLTQGRCGTTTRPLTLTLALTLYPNPNPNPNPNPSPYNLLRGAAGQQHDP